MRRSLRRAEDEVFFSRFSLANGLLCWANPRISSRPCEADNPQAVVAVTEVRYVSKVGAFLIPDLKKKSKRIQTLLGQRLHLVDASDNSDGWVCAATVSDTNGKSHKGYIKTSHLSKKQQLKIFFFDVGQGDAALIEADGATVIIDGGPNDTLYKQLQKRFRKLQQADCDACLPERRRFHIDAIVVTHFDSDHYRGLAHILRSDDFTIGTIYHNGLPRYAVRAERYLNLGDKTNHPKES